MPRKRYVLFAGETMNVLYGIVFAQNAEHAVEVAMREAAEWEDGTTIEPADYEDHGIVAVFPVHKDYTGKLYDKNPKQEWDRLWNRNGRPYCYKTEWQDPDEEDA